MAIKCRDRKYFFVGLACVILACLLVLTSCTTTTSSQTSATTTSNEPSIHTTDESAITTLEEAVQAVEMYLVDLANTPEALDFLMIYDEVRWGPHSCVLIENYSEQTKKVMSEEDYEGWDVKQYIVCHIFDDAIFDRVTYPDGEVLAQILETSGACGECNWYNETLYPVTWTVDTQTGVVRPDNHNALRVKAQLLE